MHWMEEVPEWVSAFWKCKPVVKAQVFLDPAFYTRSFAIVILSVCLSVWLSQPNRQTYRPDFQHVGQVEEYLGQVRRSMS